MSAFWSKERVELALMLRAKKYSATDIAHEIGHNCSRNAVLGMFFRIRSGEIKPQTAMAQAAAVLAKVKGDPNRVRPKRIRKSRAKPAQPKQPAPAPRPVQPQELPPASAPVLWIERRRNQCALILTELRDCTDFASEMFVCGAPITVDGGSWCDHHHGKFMQTMRSYNAQKAKRLAEAKAAEGYTRLRTVHA